MGHKVTNVIVRDRRLRWAIPLGFEQQLPAGPSLVRGAGQYLLMDFDSGCLLAFGYVWIVTCHLLRSNQGNMTT